jgi:hypothetical protein
LHEAKGIVKKFIVEMFHRFPFYCTTMKITAPYSVRGRGWGNTPSAPVESNKKLTIAPPPPGGRGRHAPLVGGETTPPAEPLLSPGRDKSTGIILMNMYKNNADII